MENHEGRERETMKERPILFSAPMVRAILEGRKTMTRRVVKPQPFILRNGVKCWGPPTDVRRYLPNGPRSATGGDLLSMTDLIGRYCPYGQPGNRLWVREEHYSYGRWVRNGFTERGNPKWRFVRVEEMPILFDPPKDGFRKSRDKAQPGKEQWYQRRARFMPKSAARIWMEVTGVRVERLQEIGEKDAIAEGVEIIPDAGVCYKDYTGRCVCKECAVYSFWSLWEKINGRESLDANPWVWVVGFKRV